MRAMSPSSADSARPVLAAVQAREAELFRREDGQEVPLGLRGARTRSKLMQAAYDVFTETGFQSSSVAMIAERAGVGTGTFYQYFRDRGDVLGQLVNAGVAELVESRRMAWRVRDGRKGLEAMIGTFVLHYAEGAALWRVWEEVTHTDVDLAAVRRDLICLNDEQVARELRRGRAAGLVDVTGDLRAVARALTAMADRFCYLTYVFDPADPPMRPAKAAELLTTLWAEAIGLREPT